VTESTPRSASAGPGSARPNGSNGRDSLGLVAPLPPQVGGVSAFAGWLLTRSDALGYRFDAFDLKGAAHGVGGELSIRAVSRQAVLTPRYLRWLRRDFTAVHYCVSLTPTGLVRDLLFIRLARAFGKPVVAQIHNVSDLDRLPRSRLLRGAVRLIARFADEVVVIAAIAETRLREIGVDSRCIYLAQRFTAPTVRAHVDGGDVTVLFAGAYGRAKGLDELLAALAQLRERTLPFRLVVVGGELRAGERTRLEALAGSLGVSGSVEFHRPVDAEALRRYYETSDIVCLPSWREGFPMTLLEGMAFGLPPVATAVGGIPELIEDGVSGLLVGRGDVDALAGALASLADAAARTRIGAAASRRASAHADGPATDAWRSTYAELLAVSPGTSYTG
jgi:glycosyltransferase involved in cell wall biosynthesis